MPDGRFPTEEEYWQRLEKRGVEIDLLDQLRGRSRRERAATVERVGPPETVVAVAARLVPSTPVPPLAMALFLDENFDKQLGRGDEQLGVMVRGRLIPAGFEALDKAAERPFGSLSEEEQDALLVRAESGDLPGPDGFDSSQWFKTVRRLMLLGFGSDPRGMVYMGFPGPSYKPGYVWLGESEVKKREQRAVGYRSF